VAGTAEMHLVYGFLERDGAVLYLRRRPGTFRGGQWELPGGTVEPGELPEPAVVREVGEETGLAVRVVGERSTHTWMDMTGRDLRIRAVVYDVAEQGRADVVLSPGEHVEHAWLGPAEAAALELAPHFRRDASGPGLS
jgi:8-oxo-dGTP diphosphatase